jgi:glycosyltransferase involved in cell wall biosynthesis
MARIYLDARPLSRPVSGFGRYCRELIPELVAQAPHHEFVMIHPGQKTENETHVFSENVRELVLCGRGTGSLLASAPRVRALFRRCGTPDLYHSLFHLLPIGVRRGAMAPDHVIVTLHDLIWIDYSRETERTRLAALWRRNLGSMAIRYALQQADHVICDSEATLREAERWISRARCTPIHLGVGREFFTDSEPIDREDPHEARSRYFAAFGVPKAYKNIGCLVRAFSVLVRNWPTSRLLLIAGDGGARHEIERYGLEQSVTIVNSPTDAQVRDVIRHAEALVVPSLVEGFGLPVLEAMALGTPAVVSRAPALLEVAGDAALAFDTTDPADLAAVLSRLLADRSLRAELARRGIERARKFTWRRTAAATLAVYDRVLESSRGAGAPPSS